jgi:sulfur-oxidizing protein SoxX
MRQPLVFILFLLLSAIANADQIARGQQVAFTFELGNCLACHEIADGDSPGNLGPALKSLNTRFNSKADLRAFIWEASAFNPNTSMPPFGKNKLLTATDLDALVDYLWQLP